MKKFANRQHTYKFEKIASFFVFSFMFLVITNRLFAKENVEKPIYKAITKEVMRPNGDPEGRPLPLALHKPTHNFLEENMIGFATPKGVTELFNLDRVLDDIDAGHYIMPFLDWPKANIVATNKVGFITPTETLVTQFKRLAATKMPFDLECGNFEDAMFQSTTKRDAAEEFWNRPAKNNPAFLDNALKGTIAETTSVGATSVKVKGFAPNTVFTKLTTFLFDGAAQVIRLATDVTINAGGEATFTLEKGIPLALAPGDLVIKIRRSMDFLSDTSPDLWKQGGINMATKDWGATEDLWKRFFDIYPDPLQIQVLGSYEGGGKTSLPDAGKSWHAVQRQAEFDAAYPLSRGITPMRQAFAKNYIDKMGAYLAGIREGLPWPEDKIKMIGNNAFGVNFEVGRWGGWSGYIVPTQESDCYLWQTWNGSLPDFYVYDWNYATDEHVGSPHIGSMQAYRVLSERAIKQVPGFLWQLGFWNGGQTKRYRYATQGGIPVSSIAGTTAEAMTSGGAFMLKIQGAKPDSLIMREGELFTIEGHSQSKQAVCTGMFDQVRLLKSEVSYPLAFQPISVGEASINSTFSSNGDTYTISGFGAGINSSTYGGLFYANQPLGTATRIQARITELSNPDKAFESTTVLGNQSAAQKKVFDAQISGETSMARAGLMMRDSNSPDAAFFSVFRLPSGKLGAMWRTKSGAQFSWTGNDNTVATPIVPVFLAIERSADNKSLIALWSVDGADWKVLNQVTMDLGLNSTCGMTATSWSTSSSLRVYTAGADVRSDGQGNATIPLAISDNGKAIAITERYGPISQGAKVRIHDYMPRIEGLSKMALWTSRPRIIRQFGYGDFDGQINAEWKALLRATDIVWKDSTLMRFWRKGNMVPNLDYKNQTGREHPMGDGLNSEPWKTLWAGENRFYQLTVDINPPFKSWPKDNDVSNTLAENVNGRIKVWAIAYVLGESPNREWLLLVQSPTQDRNNVTVTVPNFGDVKVNVQQKGTFYHLREGSTEITTVGTDSMPAPTELKQVAELQEKGIVYPNPTTGIVNFKNIEVESVEVYALDGSQVKIYDTPDNSTLNLSGVAKGVYFLKIISPKMNKFYKIILS